MGGPHATYESAREAKVPPVGGKMCATGLNVLYVLGRLRREEGRRKTNYVGESSQSRNERMREPLWLFVHKKDGDPEKGEASSVFWKHSREEHGGGMKVEDWRSKVTSTHFNALSRQVTEAVTISEGGGGAILLNNKQEFGANLLLEVVVMRGDQVLGRRNGKRGRNGAKKEEEPCTSTLVQSGGGEDSDGGEGGGVFVNGATERTVVEGRRK